MVIDKFGITAIKNAWYDPNKVTKHVLDGYTKVVSLISVFNFIFGKEMLITQC